MPSKQALRAASWNLYVLLTVARPVTGGSPLTVPRRVWPHRACQHQPRLASQALFRARLLAGEMLAEIEQVFADCGTPLFPRSAADLEMRCSCPD